MTEATTRLHITPLTPDILPAVLPPSLRQSAADISYHAIPTFPENSYGYVTLPTMDAEKIKKKLNGSILKGKKFKVEVARPSKRERDAEDANAVVEVPAEKTKKSKKRKSDDQEDSVLDGYELPSNRKVKRGWTEPSGAQKDRRRNEKSKSKGDKKEKPRTKSKYTEKEECLFQTKVPPNRAGNAADDKKAKKNKKLSENIVHEFAKTTTYPSFLRTSGEGAAPTVEFEEGKGWVDASGNVKEAASDKARKDDYHPGQVAGAKLKKPAVKNSAVKETVPESSNEPEDWTSSSGSSSEESSDSESEASSSSDDASDSSMEEEDASRKAPKETAKSTPPPKPSSDDSKSESGSDSDSEVADQPAEDAEEPSAQEVHPLEALFKRPLPIEAEEKPAPAATAGFSFFGNDDLESEDEPHSAEPQTPFTPFAKQDLQIRGLRSAAPTPDTAMINRRMNWTEADEMEEDELSIDTPVSKSHEKAVPAEETDFAKWFWEHRGENNRAWKKRRRDAAKEQRQRENRKKGMKGKS
ncbi:uncharacterized protein N7482_005337 [Penicillium canariense]|uniref:Suppressor protein SRP40 n=1 Tax=Penicillium canariense TaxID=189055 RepID=A0A9W9LMX4_9EURO|nr:uncharacterized protein N7482_005337 [Penicillium canariense]KAJ5166556.1 hypothetical protein N7482_005337 [Penicillium canariense]